MAAKMDGQPENIMPPQLGGYCSFRTVNCVFVHIFQSILKINISKHQKIPNICFYQESVNEMQDLRLYTSSSGK